MLASGPVHGPQCFPLLSLSFHRRSPFLSLSLSPPLGSLLFAYQLRPPNLFNERLINVKAHRQKGHCRRPPRFSPFSPSNALSRLGKRLVLCSSLRLLLVTRTRKRRKVGRVVGIIAIGFAEAKAPGLSSRFVEITESSVCQNRGKCWPDECLL